MKTKILTGRTIIPLVMILLFAITFMADGAERIKSNNNDNKNVKEFSGKIIDIETKKPIIFANVYIQGTSVGTVSNSDGEFIIKIPVDNLNDNLSISYIGYKNKVISINELNETGNIFKLEKDPISIDEVIVRKEDPLKLLKSALLKVKENYTNTPSMLTTFYRETIKQNRNYVAVSEAILNIYKASYTSDFSDDRVKIYKGRKSSDVKKMDTVIFKLQGGPRTSVLLDVIKNPASVLSPSYFDYYDYKFGGIVNNEGKQNYVVEFNQKADLDLLLYDGKIYLDMDNLAISRLDFSIGEIALKEAQSELVKKKPFNMKIEVESGNYLVKYRELEGKWYLNYVRSELKFKCKWDKKLFGSIYTTMLEMAVTKLDKDNVDKFPFKESAKINDVFIDQVDYFKDDDFWGDYNYIKPDESIETAISKINKKLTLK
ncbi:MAG: carboxypeptidase-like regulatory domain-containing protein [Bacteroidales bacterium]|nr:carboxypeptidase-like regulatory domain-containing protein [Bacteroidales bacterium]